VQGYATTINVDATSRRCTFPKDHIGPLLAPHFGQL